jgi:hypothetical protein
MQFFFCINAPTISYGGSERLGKMLNPFIENNLELNHLSLKMILIDDVNKE